MGWFTNQGELIRYLKMKDSQRKAMFAKKNVHIEFQLPDYLDKRPQDRTRTTGLTFNNEDELQTWLKRVKMDNPKFQYVRLDKPLVTRDMDRSVFIGNRSSNPY